jgi:hypothetical protein
VPALTVPIWTYATLSGASACVPDPKIKVHYRCVAAPPEAIDEEQMARLAEEEVDKPWGLIPNWKVLICGLTISALGVGAMTRTCSGVAVVVLVLAWMMAPHAQSPDGSPVDPTLRFEVASVKPNKAGDVHWMLAPRGSQAIGNNVPLDAVIRAAYQVSSNDIVGAPAWTSSERFDIVAKAPLRG